MTEASSTYLNHPPRTEAQARADIAAARRPATLEIMCPDCLGTGKEKYEPADPGRPVEWRDCETCHGNRTIPAPEPEEEE